MFWSGHGKGGNTLVKTVGCGVVALLFEEGLDPLLTIVDVHGPPVPVPVRVIVAFWLGKGNGGKTLVTTIGPGLVVVVLAGMDLLVRDDGV